MLFDNDTPSDIALADLALMIEAATTVPIKPLPCDRWVARSCLQKAVRRSEPALAQRALANLFQHDRRATWRHLTIIALEDVGVANIEVLARIVAAQRHRQWRTDQGGDWPVMAELVRQMATSVHCQAACDLLLRVLHDPGLDIDRAAALEMDADALAQRLWRASGLIETKATVAMALGGGLAEGQRFNDPGAVFDILAETGRSSHVVATCRAAWRISRNPMALLLPMVWRRWTAVDQKLVVDDDLPLVQMIKGVPGYALDQFTRVGNTVSRAWLKHDEELRDALTAANIPSGSQARAIGDLLFLTEGGLLARRAVWRDGDALRLPVRQLPTVHLLGHHLTSLIRQIADKGAVIAKIRAEHLLSTGRTASAKKDLGCDHRNGRNTLVFRR